jgi:hypothetical protein
MANDEWGTTRWVCFVKKIGLGRAESGDFGALEGVLASFGGFVFRPGVCFALGGGAAD